MLLEIIERKPEQILYELIDFYEYRTAILMGLQLKVKRAYEARGIPFHCKLTQITSVWNGERYKRVTKRVPSCFSIYMKIEQELTRLSSRIISAALLLHKLKKNKADSGLTKKIHRMTETAERTEARVNKMLYGILAA